jgi:hypothetical protein
MSLFAELKRRNVFRVAIAYIVLVFFPILGDPRFEALVEKLGIRLHQN